MRSTTFFYFNFFYKKNRNSTKIKSCQNSRESSAPGFLNNFFLLFWTEFDRTPEIKNRKWKRKNHANFCKNNFVKNGTLFWKIHQASFRLVRKTRFFFVFKYFHHNSKNAQFSNYFLKYIFLQFSKFKIVSNVLDFLWILLWILLWIFFVDFL